MCSMSLGCRREKARASPGWHHERHVAIVAIAVAVTVVVVVVVSLSCRSHSRSHSCGRGHVVALCGSGTGGRCNMEQEDLPGELLVSACRSFLRYISIRELPFCPGFPDSLSRTSCCI
jgi:hypothetical protein